MKSFKSRLGLGITSFLAIALLPGCDDVPKRFASAEVAPVKLTTSGVNATPTRRTDWSLDDDGRFLVRRSEADFAIFDKTLAAGPYRLYPPQETNQWNPPEWLSANRKEWIQQAESDVPVKSLLKISTKKLPGELAFDLSSDGSKLYAIADKKLVTIDLASPNSPVAIPLPLEAANGIRTIPNSKSVYLSNETTLVVYSLDQSKILASRPLPASIRQWQRAAFSDRMIAFTGDDLWVTWDSSLMSIDTLEGFSAKEMLQISSLGEYLAWEEDRKLHTVKLLSDETPSMLYPSGWDSQKPPQEQSKVLLVAGKELDSIGTRYEQFYATFFHRLQNAQIAVYQRDGKDCALCIGHTRGRDGSNTYLGVNIYNELDEASLPFVVPVSSLRRFEVSQNGERFVILGNDHLQVFERSPQHLWFIESVLGGICKELWESQDFGKLDELLDAIREGQWGSSRARGETVAMHVLERLASFVHRSEFRRIQWANGGFGLASTDLEREGRTKQAKSKWMPWIETSIQFYPRIGYSRGSRGRRTVQVDPVDDEPLVISGYRVTDYRGDLHGLINLHAKNLERFPESMEVHLLFLIALRSHREFRSGMDIDYIEKVVKAYREEDRSRVRLILAWCFLREPLLEAERSDKTPEEYLKGVHAEATRMLDESDWRGNWITFERLAAAGAYLKAPELEKRLREFVDRYFSVSRTR